MAYRSASVPIDGLARVFNELRDSGWTATPMPEGLRLRAGFDYGASCGGLLVGGVAAFAALVLATYSGTWATVARVAAWIVCGLSVLAVVVTFRRRTLVIHTGAKRVRGSDFVHGAIDAAFTDIRAVEIVRRPREGTRGSATMTWIVGESSHRVLYLGGLGDMGLARTKAVALGFAALFGAELTERSTAAACAALAAADRSLRLPISDGGDASIAEQAREVGAHVERAAEPIVDTIEAFLRVLEQ